MSDSRPTDYDGLAQRPESFREAELLPAAADPLNTVAMAELMYRRYALASPVSGTRTAIMHLRHFQRTAQLMIEAHDEAELAEADKDWR